MEVLDVVKDPEIIKEKLPETSEVTPMDTSSSSCDKNNDDGAEKIKKINDSVTIEKEPEVLNNGIVEKPNEIKIIDLLSDSETTTGESAVTTTKLSQCTDTSMGSSGMVLSSQELPNSQEIMLTSDESTVVPNETEDIESTLIAVAQENEQKNEENVRFV